MTRQFTREVRFRLTVVASMTPSSKRYCSLLRSHGDLVHLATPMWFDPWPDSALAVIASHELATERLVFPEGTLYSQEESSPEVLGTYLGCVDGCKWGRGIDGGCVGGKERGGGVSGDRSEFRAMAAHPSSRLVPFVDRLPHTFKNQIVI